MTVTLANALSLAGMILAAYVAVKVARLGAKQRSLVQAVDDFSSDTSRWTSAVSRLVSPPGGLQPSMKELLTLRDEIHSSFRRICMFAPKQTERWLRRHWVRRQLRLEAAMEGYCIGRYERSTLAMYFDDYELAMPTIFDQLRSAVRVRRC